MSLARTFLAMGIVVLFAVFISYWVYVFYEPPKYDYTDYWLTLNKYLRLFALGFVLLLLIFVGYKKIEKKLRR